MHYRWGGGGGGGGGRGYSKGQSWAQRYMQNSVKHLWWSFFLEFSLMLNRVLNTHLGSGTCYYWYIGIKYMKFIILSIVIPISDRRNNENNITKWLHDSHLTHLFQMHPFSTPWKHATVFWCFQGVEKGCIENKWVNDIMVLKTKVIFDPSSQN